MRLCYLSGETRVSVADEVANQARLELNTAVIMGGNSRHALEERVEFQRIAPKRDASTE